MYIDKANLMNLTGLWQKYGAQTLCSNLSAKVLFNPRWPFRCWIDQSIDNIEHQHITSCLDALPEFATVPVWPITESTSDSVNGSLNSQANQNKLLNDDWQCGFEQLAMYKKLPSNRLLSAQSNSQLEVSRAASHEDIEMWVQIGSEAFAYQIDINVIKPLVNDKDIQLLLAWHNGQPAACALLYKTNEVIGIHQVAVKHAFQGKGIAKNFMQHIIATCSQWQGEYMVLQASLAGQPLYEKLGFKAQFKIKNYQRIPAQTNS